MSTISSCPKCAQSVTIPSGADPNATVRCPLCQGEYTLQEALDKAPPLLVLVSNMTEELPSDAWSEVQAAEVAPVNSTSTSIASETLPDELVFESNAVTLDHQQVGADPLEIDTELEDKQISAAGPAVGSLEDDPEDIGIGLETRDLGELAFDDEESDEMTIESNAAGAEGNNEGGIDFAAGDEIELAESSEEEETFNFGDSVTFGEPVGASAAAEGQDGAQDAPVNVGIKTSPRQKKREASGFSTLIGMVGGGVIGLSIGYLIVLWIAGPSKDFLKLGPVLPGWMLPAEFSQVKQAKASPQGSRAREPQANAPLAQNDGSEDTSNPLPAADPAESSGSVDSDSVVSDPTVDAQADGTAADTQPADSAPIETLDLPTGDDDGALSPPDLSADLTSPDSLPSLDIGQPSAPDDLSMPADPAGGDTSTEAMPVDDTGLPAGDDEAAGDDPLVDDPGLPSADMPADEAAETNAQSTDSEPDPLALDVGPPEPALDDPAAGDDPLADEVMPTESPMEEMPAENGVSPAAASGEADPAMPTGAAMDEDPFAESDNPAADSAPAPAESNGLKLREPVNYTADELTQAVSDLQAAATALAAGDASDKETLKKLRRDFYVKFYRLGEVATHAKDEPSAALQSQKESACQLLQALASDSAKVDDAGRQAASWLGYSKRGEHAGIVLGGTVESVEKQGDIYAMQVALTGNAKVTILSPQPPGVRAHERVVVLGSIVDDPANKLVGYEGTQNHVVLLGMAAKAK